MRPIKTALVAGGLAALFAVTCATAGTREDIETLQHGQQDLQDRIARLEAQNQGLLEMLQTIEQLQTELRQLRGDVEYQTNELDGVRKRQRELYLDIDRRLNDLQLQSAGPAGSPPAPGDQPVTGTGTLPTEGATAAGATAGSQDADQERNEYKEAFEILREGRYPQAIEAFTRFLQKYPNGGYADNAQYWLGEANYVSRNFEQALVEFNKVLEQYPQSSKIPDARLKLGYTYYELQQWDKARQMLNETVNKHAGTSVAPLAEKRLLRMTQEGH
jgi:tol-pal system protein YbgF